MFLPKYFHYLGQKLQQKVLSRCFLRFLHFFFEKRGNKNLNKLPCLIGLYPIRYNFKILQLLSILLSWPIAVYCDCCLLRLLSWPISVSMVLPHRIYVILYPYGLLIATSGIIVRSHVIWRFRWRYRECMGLVVSLTLRPRFGTVFP